MSQTLLERAPTIVMNDAWSLPPKDRDVDIAKSILIVEDEENARIGYEDALKAAHVDYAMYVYPNVNHAFFDDTTDRYNADAAKLAWDRARAHFSQHLKA